MGPLRRNVGVVVLTVAVAAIVGVAVALIPGAGDVGSRTIESVGDDGAAGQDAGSESSESPGTPPITPVPTTVSPPPTTAPPPTAQTTAPTTVPATTVPATTVQGPILERADVMVTVANATNFPGVAGRTATELEARGYVGVDAVDADPVGQTVVYHLDGFDREARRVVEDLELALVAIPVRPVDLAPATTPTVSFDVLVVIGTDQI